MGENYPKKVKYVNNIASTYEKIAKQGRCFYKGGDIAKTIGKFIKEQGFSFRKILLLTNQNG